MNNVHVLNIRARSGPFEVKIEGNECTLNLLTHSGNEIARQRIAFILASDPLAFAHIMNAFDDVMSCPASHSHFRALKHSLVVGLRNAKGIAECCPS